MTFPTTVLVVCEELNLNKHGKMIGYISFPLFLERNDRLLWDWEAVTRAIGWRDLWGTPYKGQYNKVIPKNSFLKDISYPGSKNRRALSIFLSYFLLFLFPHEISFFLLKYGHCFHVSFFISVGEHWKKNIRNQRINHKVNIRLTISINEIKIFSR